MMQLMASGSSKKGVERSDDEDDDSDEDSSDGESESDGEKQSNLQDSDDGTAGDDSDQEKYLKRMKTEDEANDDRKIGTSETQPAKEASTSRINVAHIKQTAAVLQRRPLSIPEKPNLKRTFVDLGLAPQLIVALRGISIRTPTDIQAATFESMLRGRDVIGCAKTGSGKTMAFALPILQRIARDPFGIFAVVLTPTR